MIEKIGTEEAKWLSTPCKEVVEYLEKLLSSNTHPLTVAEIGVGIGATSLEIVKRLRAQDAYHFFSFSDEVDELYRDLKDFGCKCELVPFGNSRKTHDSYCWPLAKLALETDSAAGIYDLVYLDGGHNLNWTGLGCVILKQLVKPGGFLIFDDLNWTYASSPTVNPDVRPATKQGYTDEQIKTPQVQMVVDLFMENDPRWICVKNTKRRAVYQKKGGDTKVIKRKVKKFSHLIAKAKRVLLRRNHETKSKQQL